VGTPKPKRNTGTGKDVSVGSPKPKRKNTEHKPKRGGSESLFSKTVKTKNKSTDTIGKSTEKTTESRGSGSAVSRRGERKLDKKTDDDSTVASDKTKQVSTDTDDKPNGRGYAGAVTYTSSKEIKPAEAEDKPTRGGSESALKKTVKTKKKSFDTEGKSNGKSPKSRGSGSSVSRRGERKLGKEPDDDSTEKISKSRVSGSAVSCRGERKLANETDDGSTVVSGKTKKKSNDTDDKPKRRGSANAVETEVNCETQAKGLITEPKDKPEQATGDNSIPRPPRPPFSMGKPPVSPLKKRTGIAKHMLSMFHLSAPDISVDDYDKPKRRNSDSAAIYLAEANGLIAEPQDWPARRMSGNAIGNIFKSKKKGAEAEGSADGDKPKRRNSETAANYETQVKGLITEPKDKPEQATGDNSVPRPPVSPLSLGKPPLSPTALSAKSTTKRRIASANNTRSMFKIPNAGKSSSDDASDAKKTNDGSTVASDKTKIKSTDTDDKPKRRVTEGSVSCKGSKGIKSERGTDDSSTVGSPKPKRNAGIGMDGSIRSPIGTPIGTPKPKRKITVGSKTGKDAKSKSNEDGDHTTTTTKKKVVKNADKSKSPSHSTSGKGTQKNKLELIMSGESASSKESRSEKSKHLTNSPGSLSSKGSGKKKVKSRRAERTIDEEDEKRQIGKSVGVVNKEKFRKNNKKQERTRSFGDNVAQDGLAIAMPDLVSVDAFTDREALDTISLIDATSASQEKEMLESDLLFNKLEVVRLRQSLENAIKDSESQRQERKVFAKATTELMQLKMEHQQAVEEKRRLRADLDTGRCFLESMSLELKPLESKY
jgi:hypothetical protein